MKRGQITKYEGVCCSTNQEDVSLHDESVTRSNPEPRSEKVKVLHIAFAVALLISLVTAFVSAVQNICAFVEERNAIMESYTSTVEEREDELRTLHKNVNVQKLKFEIHEVRTPIAFAEATPREEFVLYVDEDNYESGYLSEIKKENVDESLIDEFEDIVEETTEAIVEIPEEYKPIKLSGYEISAVGPYEHYIYILSEEDMKIIAKLVWMESRGECYEGKVAVAAVVLNRYFSDNRSFSRESILHTVTQEYQFASIWGVTDWDLNNVPDCLEAVKDACRGWDPTREVFEEGALFFYAPKGVSGYQAEIRQNIKVMVIGNHNFHFDFEKVNG